MKRNPFGWDYPPGTEFHPDAPWNQKESPPESCSECDFLVYDELNDHATCSEGNFEIEGSLNCYPSNCPLDRRDSQEAREDYLADKADNKRKYGKEA